ncbi:cytochrome c family protein [Sulfitobacter albidus]|uniref:Cytochrome c family protein n=2 Tax=Sulfitobacter albidus TaxID=2829501 RepID=A0A975JHI1_9RHOB|nr:cytochrome c family protein [Sulfitobacter albidus]
MLITKLGAGVIGAWLVLLLGGWAAEELYHAELHGEPSYSIEVASDAPEEEVEEVPFEELMASADAGAGERVFRKCTACHKIGEGENATGPYMHGVVGREVGSADGYNSYSGALSEQADVWDVAALNGFLEAPAAWAPGTSMGFAGIKDPEERANLIAYLDSLDD